MTEETFYRELRRILLELVDVLEKRVGMTPTTAQLRQVGSKAVEEARRRRQGACS